MRIDERAGLLLDAKTRQDLLFRLRFDPGENSRERNWLEHGERFLLTADYTVPDFTRLFGKDTSHWDGNINQAASKAAGVRFTWAKAMDGTIPSRYFKENKTRAREAGLPEGPYNWLYPNSLLSCKLQADTLHNYLQPLPKSDLPLMVDWEWTKWNGQPANPNMTDLEMFVDQWLNRGNRKPVLYTARGYSALFGAMPKRLRDKFEGVCVASYGGASPLMPLGWPDWILWQFTAHAEAARFSPNDAHKLNLDLIYVCDAETLQRLGGGTVVEPEPEPTDPTDPDNGTGEPMFTGEVIVTELNIRTTPDVSHSAIGKLRSGDRVEASGKVNGWWKITKITSRAGANVPLPGPSCYSYEGDNNGYIKDVTPTPTPTPTEDRPKKITLEMTSGKVFVADQFTQI